MTHSERGRGNGLRPKDFEERGAAVPFSTRVLFFARLRQAPDRSLEYLVPGLTGGLETCIIPHGKIGQALSLSIFDRALMEELEFLNRVSPANVDDAAHSIALSGLGGSRLMRLARARKDAIDDQRPAMQGHLINAVQRAAGQQLIDPAQLRDPEGGDALKPLLSVAAAQIQVPAEALLSQTSQWAEALLPVGLPEGSSDAPYRKTLAEMERFAAELSKWLIPEPVGPAEMAQRISVAARETITVANGILAGIDALAADVESGLQDWDRTWARLTTEVETLSHVIDGWQRLVDGWDKVGRMDRIDQREVVELFALYVPILPIAPSDKTHNFWINLKESQKRWNSMIGTPDLFTTDDNTRDKLSGFKVEAA